MATVHREPNQVKWVGVRPGHNGEQVLININRNANALLYTVGVGKLLMLYDWQIGMVLAANLSCSLYIRTDAAAPYYYLAYLSTATNVTGGNMSNNTCVPIEVPAAYDFYIECASWVRGGIHGILIDV